MRKLIVAITVLVSLATNANAEMIDLTCVLQDGSQFSINVVIDVLKETVYFNGKRGKDLTISKGEFRFTFTASGATYMNTISRSTGVMQVYDLGARQFTIPFSCNKATQIF